MSSEPAVVAASEPVVAATASEPVVVAASELVVATAAAASEPVVVAASEPVVATAAAASEPVVVAASEPVVPTAAASETAADSPEAPVTVDLVRDPFPQPEATPPKVMPHHSSQYAKNHRDAERQKTSPKQPSVATTVEQPSAPAPVVAVAEAAAAGPTTGGPTVDQLRSKISHYELGVNTARDPVKAREQTDELKAQLAKMEAESAQKQPVAGEDDLQKEAGGEKESPMPIEEEEKKLSAKYADWQQVHPGWVYKGEQAGGKPASSIPLGSKASKQDEHTEEIGPDELQSVAEEDQQLLRADSQQVKSVRTTGPFARPVKHVLGGWTVSEDMQSKIEHYEKSISKAKDPAKAREHVKQMKAVLAKMEDEEAASALEGSNTAAKAMRSRIAHYEKSVPTAKDPVKAAKRLELLKSQLADLEDGSSKVGEPAESDESEEAEESDAEENEAKEAEENEAKEAEEPNASEADEEAEELKAEPTEATSDKGPHHSSEALTALKDKIAHYEKSISSAKDPAKAAAHLDELKAQLGLMADREHESESQEDDVRESPEAMKEEDDHGRDYMDSPDIPRLDIPGRDY